MLQVKTHCCFRCCIYRYGCYIHLISNAIFRQLFQRCWYSVLPISLSHRRCICLQCSPVYVFPCMILPLNKHLDSSKLLDQWSWLVWLSSASTWDQIWPYLWCSPLSKCSVDEFGEARKLFQNSFGLNVKESIHSFTRVDHSPLLPKKILHLVCILRNGLWSLKHLLSKLYLTVYVRTGHKVTLSPWPWGQRGPTMLSLHLCQS